MTGRFKLKDPIAKRLVILIISASSLFALLTVAIQLAFNYMGAVRHVEGWVDDYNRANLARIERAVWQSDQPLLEELLRGLVQQQYVASVEFSSTIGGGLKIGQGAAKQKSYHYQLNWHGVALGKLIIGLDLSQIKQDITEQALVILFTNGLKTFLMSLIILLLVSYLVTGDLRLLADTADQIFTDQQKMVPLPTRLLKRSDEIGLVASSMQQLQQRLQTGLEAHNQAELALQLNHQELEQRVKQRTEELNWQTEANQLLSEISLAFLNQKPNNSKALLQRASSAIASLFPVELVAVLEFERQQAVYRDIWSLPGQLSFEIIDLSPLEQLKRRMVNVAPIVVRDIAKLRHIAPNEYALLKKMKINSFIGVPLSDGRKSFGLLACASLKSCVTMDEHQVILLSQFAAAISGLLISEKNHIAMARLQNELLQVNERLQVLAETDELTGLVNRRPFKRELTRAVTGARRRKSQFAVMMVDIDFFKAYNDHYGHVQGDQALKQVAHALSTVVQRSDDCVARVGGEEFAILVLDANKQDLPKMAQRVVDAVANLEIEHSGSSIARVLTVSLGGVLVEPDDVLEPAKLLEMADACLYKAKNQGRNRAILDIES